MLYRTIASSIAASIAFVMELALVPLILPAIQSYYDLNISELAWVFNSYGIAVAFGVILSGWLGDAFSIKRLFGIGVLLFASGAIFAAYAESFEAMIAARVLQGFGGGVFSPLVPLLLTSSLPKRPGKILIIWGSITGYVAAFAPLVASQATALVGWQSVFLLFAIISGAALIMAMTSQATEPRPVQGTPPNLRLLLQARELWLVYGYIFCTYGAITLYLFRLPLFLTDTDSSLQQIGIVLTVVWLSFSIASTFLRNMVDGALINVIVLAAPAFIAASFVVVFLSNDTVWLLLSAACVGAGFACSNAPSTQLVLRFAPKGLSAISASLDITFARIGGVIAVGLFAQYSFGGLVSIVLALSCGGLLLAMLFLRKAGNG